MLDCTPELRRSVEFNLLPLCAELLAVRLINEDNERSLRNRNVEGAYRAADLVSLVTQKVRESPSNYQKFVAILKKDEKQYKTVIGRLEEKYKSHKGTLAELVPQLQSSNGYDNPGALAT